MAFEPALVNLTRGTEEDVRAQQPYTACPYRCAFANGAGPLQEIYMYQKHRFGFVGKNS